MLAESALRLLGVRFPVTDFKASVESAYRKLAVALHPDKGARQMPFGSQNRPVTYASAIPRNVSLGPRPTRPTSDCVQTLAW